VQGILTPLGRILNHAARRGLIADNPMRRLERRERPRVERREMRILNSEEIDAVLRVATPAYRNVLATAVFTGVRQSELLGLTWADVDLDRGDTRKDAQTHAGDYRSCSRVYTDSLLKAVY
jgi:integrase